MRRTAYHPHTCLFIAHGSASRFPLLDLATAAVLDFLGEPDEEFERAARRVLAKDEELYRRLS